MSLQSILALLSNLNWRRVRDILATGATPSRLRFIQLLAAALAAKALWTYRLRTLIELAPETMPDLLSSLDAGVSAALQANRPLDVVNALRRQRVARAVYNRLEPFFLNGVEDFLAALDQARGALTGSWAAELVLAPVSWTPQDLDIVVPGPDDDSKKIVEAVLRAAGYRREVSYQVGSMRRSGNPNLRSVATWKNPVLSKKIDILTSRLPTILELVLGFHSTFVQNMVTRDHIIVLFPHTTFRYISLAAVGITEKAYNKYRRRGVQFDFSSRHQPQPCEVTCPSAWRGITVPDSCMVVSMRQSSSSETYALPPDVLYRSPVKCTISPRV